MAESPKAPRAAGATSRKRASRGAEEVSAKQRYRMIQEAAYYRAEKHGFDPGRAMQDWLEAEQEINGLLQEISGLLKTRKTRKRSQ
jgi:hypothetical protein